MFKKQSSRYKRGFRRTLKIKVDFKPTPEFFYLQIKVDCKGAGPRNGNLSLCLTLSNMLSAMSKRPRALAAGNGWAVCREVSQGALRNSKVERHLLRFQMLVMSRCTCTSHSLLPNPGLRLSNPVSRES